MPEDLLHPVVAPDILIKVDVAERAEQGDIAFVDFILHGGKFILPADKIIGIHDGRGAFVRHPFSAAVGIVGDAHLALFSGFGGDEHNAVGAAATVDGRREGILQYVDGLDVGSCDIADAFHRETVHDVEGG